MHFASLPVLINAYEPGKPLACPWNALGVYGTVRIPVWTIDILLLALVLVTIYFLWSKKSLRKGWFLIGFFLFAFIVSVLSQIGYALVTGHGLFSVITSCSYQF